MSTNKLPFDNVTYAGNGSVGPIGPYTGNGPFHIQPATISGSSISYDRGLTDIDHIIQGEMITVSHSMSDVVYTDTMISPNEIKKLLVTALVEKMWQSNKIEFTKVTDMASLKHSYIPSMEHTFRARIFVVPDTQVRILREKGFDK